MNKAEFIDKTAAAVIKYAPLYGIKVYSAIIAQAILESAWGKSSLSSKYNNHFGLKCWGDWTGKSVNMKTQEEFVAGEFTTVVGAFRVYDSFDDGVRGYFDFIQYPRYSELRNCTTPESYMNAIKKAGYATASNYVAACLELVDAYNLDRFDPVKNTHLITVTMPVSLVARQVIRGDYGNGDVRKRLLTEAGYNYEEVQAEVNKQLGLEWV